MIPNGPFTAIFVRIILYKSPYLILFEINNYNCQVAALDDVSHESAQHDAFMASLHENFTGRQLLLRQCLQTLHDMSSGVLMLSGRPGVGKSALMVSGSKTLNKWWHVTKYK